MVVEKYNRSGERFRRFIALVGLVCYLVAFLHPLIAHSQTVFHTSDLRSASSHQALSLEKNSASDADGKCTTCSLLSGLAQNKPGLQLFQLVWALDYHAAPIHAACFVSRRPTQKACRAPPVGIV